MPVTRRWFTAAFRGGRDLIGFAESRIPARNGPELQIAPDVFAM
jgi:hypothetical protein